MSRTNSRFVLQYCYNISIEYCVRLGWCISQAKPNYLERLPVTHPVKYPIFGVNFQIAVDRFIDLLLTYFGTWLIIIIVGTRNHCNFVKKTCNIIRKEDNWMPWMLFFAVRAYRGHTKPYLKILNDSGINIMRIH